MTRTPDVVDGSVIQSTWGNEIRDRTFQVFASIAERDAWPAPNGAHCVVLGSGAAHNDTEYKRANGTWQLAGNFQRGSGSYNTDVNSQVIIPHLLGQSPATSIFSPGGTPATLGMLKLTAATAANVTVKCLNYSGTAYPGGTAVSIHWVLYL